MRLNQTKKSESPKASYLYTPVVPGCCGKKPDVVAILGDAMDTLGDLVAKVWPVFLKIYRALFPAPEDVDDCASSPCAGGSCVDGTFSYSCTCAHGWEGENCADDINDCISRPCKHGRC
eukprot:SAG25_NODE_3254_length_1156_cov_1.174078_1_plen_118_part_10